MSTFLPHPIDISLPIRPDMPVFPGDPAVRFEPAAQIDNGDDANLLSIYMGSHTGTHFDAPHHILNNHKMLDEWPLERFTGPARVVEIPETIREITATVLQPLQLDGVTRVLFKTANSRFWKENPKGFDKDFPALTEDGAQYLAHLGVQLVGIDSLSIERFESSGLKAHKALLSHDVIILEGLYMPDIIPGDYTLLALPLAYQATDGAPTRAALLPLS